MEVPEFIDNPVNVKAPLESVVVPLETPFKKRVISVPFASLDTPVTELMVPLVQ